ncbi:HPr family phosphocarrier protein [Streptomyces sp. NPDC003952]
MAERTVTINDRDQIGFHARPVAKVIQAISQFKDTEVTITKTASKETVDAKSMLSVMGLGVKYKDEITFKADGPDADTAIKAAFQAMTDQHLI